MLEGLHYSEVATVLRYRSVWHRHHNPYMGVEPESIWYLQGTPPYWPF